MVREELGRLHREFGAMDDLLAALDPRPGSGSGCRSPSTRPPRRTLARRYEATAERGMYRAIRAIAALNQDRAGDLAPVRLVGNQRRRSTRSRPRLRQPPRRRARSRRWFRHRRRHPPGSAARSGSGLSSRSPAIRVRRRRDSRVSVASSRSLVGPPEFDLPPASTPASARISASWPPGVDCGGPERRSLPDRAASRPRAGRRGGP